MNVPAGTRTNVIPSEFFISRTPPEVAVEGPPAVSGPPPAAVSRAAAWVAAASASNDFPRAVVGTGVWWLELGDFREMILDPSGAAASRGATVTWPSNST